MKLFGEGFPVLLIHFQQLRFDNLFDLLFESYTLMMSSLGSPASLQHSFKMEKYLPLDTGVVHRAKCIHQDDEKVWIIFAIDQIFICLIDILVR